MGECVSRRSFVKGAGVGAAGVMSAGLVGVASADETASWEPEKWDAEADIIVVGYGGSGVCATIAAIDAGASVIALEKAPAREGGNMACSGGQLHETSEDVDAWYDMYVYGAYGADASEEISRAYIDFVNEMPAWFEEHGIAVTWLETEGDGYKTPLKYLTGLIDSPEGFGGIELFNALDAAATSREADVRVSTRARRLIQNPLTKEILGVIAEDAEGNELTFKAKKAVILACGGFENDPWMHYNFGKPGIRFIPEGTPYNTGDGFPMATEVGAALWHMGLMEYSDYFFVVPSDLAGFGYQVDTGASYSYVFVDRHGKRYRDERSRVVHSHPNLPEIDYDDSIYQYKHRPMYMVFDQAMFDALNPLWNMPTSYPKVRQAKNPDETFAVDWSSNEAAVEQGWLFKGETLEELAANMKGNEACVSSEYGIYAVEGVDAEGLKKTVEDFNAYCEAGEDAEFGRPIEEMTPLGSGPYYAIEITNGVMNTNGGPMRNEYSQTLNGYGEIIPRLYNVGEFGSYNGLLYNFGNLMEAATTGRVAAEHAAALEAWDA